MCWGLPVFPWLYSTQGGDACLDGCDQVIQGLIRHADPPREAERVVPPAFERGAVLFPRAQFLEQWVAVERVVLDDGANARLTGQEIQQVVAISAKFRPIEVHHKLVVDVPKAIRDVGYRDLGHVRQGGAQPVSLGDQPVIGFIQGLQQFTAQGALSFPMQKLLGQMLSMSMSTLDIAGTQ